MENKNQELSQKLAEKINMANIEKKQIPQQTQDSILKWNPEDRFIFTGEEWGTIVNTLRNITESRGFLDELMKARQVIGIASLQELVQKKLEAYTTTGQVRKLTKEQFEKEQLKEQEQTLKNKLEKSENLGSDDSWSKRVVLEDLEVEG